MRARKKTILFALLAAFTLTAAACGGSTVTDAVDEATDAATDAADGAVDEATEAAEGAADEAGDAVDEAVDEVTGDEDMALPGEGKTINMARADWSTGYIQAEIYRQILTELGYEVTDPSETEVGPSLAYQQMAEGNIDFWANSWYPGHSSWWKPELTDGTLVGDHLVRPAAIWEDSGLQGWLVTKQWVDDNGITTMDQINSDEALWSALPDSDGDGKHEFYACPESWTCDDIQESMAAFAGWDNLQPLKAGYEVMFAEFVDRANAGEAAIMYTWAPSAYLTQAIPGQNVYWLSVEPSSVLDDSNPLGIEGGDEYAQSNTEATFGDDVCTQGSGGCNLGWEVADIEVTANADWAEANPEVIAMFAEMDLSLIDITLAIGALADSEGTQDDVVKLASQYIEENRDQVDAWEAVAINYAG